MQIVMNGIKIEVDRHTTLLEAARYYGIPIPTLCHMEGLTSYGACRLCVVEIGEGARAKLVSACTYLAEEGLKVRTASHRVVNARRMILELLLASSPQSKTIQDLAAAHDVRRQRFRQEYEDCILCGLCVRICKEQMMSGAIGFRGRGQTRSIGTPFDIPSDIWMRRLHVCMSGVPVPLHVQSTGESNLRRLRESESAVSWEKTISRHDVLHVALCGVRAEECH